MAAGIVSRFFHLRGKTLHFSGAGRGFASVDPGLDLESPPISFGNLLTESLGGIRAKHGDGTSAEASAGHTGAINALHRERALHQKVQLLAAHFIIVAQAAV